MAQRVKSTETKITFKSDLTNDGPQLENKLALVTGSTGWHRIRHRQSRRREGARVIIAAAPRGA
jgi:hypothetical protein